MGRLAVRKQRRMLLGWFKWTPVVAIPFAVLFIHAWLNVHILRADYVLRELDREARELQEQLRHAGVVQAVQQAPEALAVHASQMEFILPQPGQQEIIAYNAVDIRPMPEDKSFELARRTPASMVPNEPVRMAKPTKLEAPAGAATIGAATATATATAGADTAVSAAPVTDTERATAPMAPAGLPDTEWVTVEVALPVTATASAAASSPVASPSREPEPVRPPVMLDLPEDLFIEELLPFDLDTGGLEVL